jgi:hypothetical protein
MLLSYAVASNPATHNLQALVLHVITLLNDGTWRWGNKPAKHICITSHQALFKLSDSQHECGSRASTG